MTVAKNLGVIKKDIPQNVKLVAVSKYYTQEAIKEAYDAGQRFFGESRMQELKPKQEALPADIEWHFIGHLQTNKVKAIIPYTHTIHSVDSWKLLYEIEKQASAIGKTINCLLEIHIAEEESKYGFSYDDCRRFFIDNDWTKFIFANVVGLMGVATNSDNEDVIRQEFRQLKSFFNELKRDFFYEKDDFSQISMGMSHDFKIAIEEGTTMVRIGSAIFET